MERGACVEVQENGDTEVVKESTGPSPYRYTKEELLEMKYFPISNERPDCLLEKFDSDGVWDPEKWHASLYPTSECSSPVDGYKDFVDDRIPLKRRIADPRERLKEDDLDVVLSPQRRSFGGGCVGNALPAPTRRPVSPLENKENDSLRLGVARRIGSGRIMAARGFEREREPRVEKERDFKDKRFRRDFGDKRVFSERRRNDLEEEPEWFSGGPTSQSETIELIGFDDKILEEDKRRPKRSRKRTDAVREVECNGGLAEEQVVRDSHSTADQEVPHPEVLPEQTSGDFDFNEFFNLEKTMPGLASVSPGQHCMFKMIEDVLGEGPVSASRFSRWFSSNLSPSGSRSSSLRSTPHEELERLAAHSGVVLSLEEVEGGLKGLKVGSELHHQMPRKAHQQQGGSTSSGTPFMAEHLEQALTGGAGPPCSRARDPDMAAFNKLVSSMKASGTLPSHPKENQVNSNLNQPSNPAVVPLPEAKVPAQQHKNIFQELLGAQGPPCRGSPSLLHSLLGSPNAPPHPGPQHSLLQHRGPSPPLYPQRAPSPDYFHGRMHPPAGYPVGPQPMMGEQFPEIHRSFSPGPGHGPTLQQQQQMRALSMAVDQADRQALIIQQDLALHTHHAFQTGYNKPPPNKAYQHNRQTRMNRSPGPGPHPAGRNSPGNIVTSMLSPSFVPTSVIRKMYATKEKSRDEPGSRPDSKEGHSQGHSQEDSSSPSSFLDGMDGSGSQSGRVKACSTPLSSHSQARQYAKDHQERPRPGSAGHHTPTLVSPRSVSPFPCPIYPVPLLSHGHVPMVRPALPQLHPSVLQRMLAQGIQPQQLGPALIQAGIFPQHVDLSPLQGLPSTLLGQPLYPLGATGHPLLLPRASNPMQLALMQQQQPRPMHPTVPGHQLQNHGPHRTNHSQQRVGSPPGVGGAGLAKWFGSDVLQQPLPSMPSKVITVDELEFGPSGVSYNQNSG
ncbi:eukaryotic translation initiation factor 4E transporter isoform 7-T8 [Salvelinus alpinus]|uniref:eukaryotic translation initiation factor 4E transporter isoform X6 n=1 Tax=Salvelinus alpinus TaxID=8036 RepID=UPI0039FCBA81